MIKNSIFLSVEVTNMLGKKVTVLLFITSLLVGMSSCKKDCVLPEENTNAGSIVENSYVQGHGFQKNMVFRYNKNDFFRVSFDKGETFKPIDFNKFLVMNFPTNVDCNAIVSREVTISPSSKKVTFTVTEFTCDDCDHQYQLENWVLVPTFPENYDIVYIKK